MQRTLLIVLLLLVSVSVGYNIYFTANSPNLAFIRSHDLISKYAGTVEARAEFEKKKSAMMANVDSLKSLFERSRQGYAERAGSMSASLRKETEDRLDQQHAQVLQYTSAIQNKIDEEDSKLMSAVLTQVNSFVEEYAKANDLDIVMGTTLSGNLLYGNKSMDVTEDLLEKLNERYKGR